MVDLTSTIVTSIVIKGYCPSRARDARACSMAGQWDDGFTPSRGIRCEVVGDALTCCQRKLR
jgi:hypothetical protein